MRLKEYDILKGIGIILVLLGHTGISGLPYNFIYAFHMPLFFFASGCFYKQRDPLTFLKKKAKGLLLPHLFFAVCFFVLSVALDSIHLYSLTAGLKTTLASINPFDEHCWVLYRTIWFLLCLFEVCIMYYIIDSFNCNIGLKMLWITMLSLLGYILHCRSDYQCFFLDSACSCTLYYALGHYFRNTKLDEQQPKISYLMFFGLTLLVMIAILRPNVAFVRNKYPFYLPILAVTSIVNLFYVIMYCQFYAIRLSTCLSWLGDNSLAILGVHSFFYYLFDYFFVDRVGGILFVMLKFTATLPFIYITIILVKMLFPIMFGEYETKRV